MTTLQDWLDALGQPERYSFSASLTRLCVYPPIPKRDPARTVRVEMWLQANGPGTAQRVCKVFPEGIDGPLPAVVVPFYYPEAMLALDPATGETLASFAEIPMLLELAARGYAAATADAYHLTYCPSDKVRDDFSRWQDSADALHRDHPHWTGMGKLVADTALLTDALAEDPRVDAHRIGIAGHSLGGLPRRTHFRDALLGFRHWLDADQLARRLVLGRTSGYACLAGDGSRTACGGRRGKATLSLGGAIRRRGQSGAA